ncbi:MAG: D-aminoacylase [Desulfobacterales bacterium]|jgi:N-acyl-D-amino-acid deacylase
MHDIVIRNANVIDGSGKPAYGADVAVDQGRIADIGDLSSSSARDVIDAEGLVVTPGFIDMHSHADFSLPIWPTADSIIHQGITTAVVGQCGLSPAPLLDESREEVVAALSGFFGEFVKDVPWQEWSSMGDYLNFLTNQGVSPNVLQLVGQGVIRASIMGLGEGSADRKQVDRMQDQVAEAMAQGAIGLSTGLIYPPGSFTSTEELIALTKTVGDHNGYYFSHIRGEGDTLLEAVEEAICIGRETGTPVQISHFKAAREDNWDKSSKALELIDRAQAEGLDVTADVYPYLAGSTSLVTMLPQWAHVGGPAEILMRLTDPDTRTKMSADMQTGGFARGVAWNSVLITSSPNKREYEGCYVSELAAQSDSNPYEWVFDALVETQLDMGMALFGMSEENRLREIQFPAMMICTDGFGLAITGPLARGVPHPRNYGAFPRVLGRYARDLKVLSLEQAVYKMTGLPAKKLRLEDRGMIVPDSAADLVVFDPAVVSDTATYDNPHQYPAGIYHVLVNGQWVIRDGSHTGARPGAVLRIGKK